MKRYGYDWAGFWLINTHNGLKDKRISPVDINDYLAIKEWLDNGGVAYSGKIYKGLSQIEKRSDQGDHHTIYEIAHIWRIFLSQKLCGEKYPINQNLLLTFFGGGIYTRINFFLHERRIH